MSKLILSTFLKTKIAAVKTWEISKLIAKFIKNWSDLIIFLPLSLVIFITSDRWVRHLDPTAAVLSAENFSIVSFNWFILFLTFSSSYVIWRLYFGGDYFTKQWWKKVETKNPVVAPVVSAVLFIVTLVVCYLILGKNL